MALTATIVASRVSGMTPLAVFFEATASIDAVGNKIGDSGGGNGLLNCDIVEYHWDFGDGTTATGFVAAHVFEPSGDAGANGEPSGAGGSYTVTLTVTDSSDNTDTDTVGITVDAFAGTTYYVRSDGNDANGGDGPGVGDAWQTYDKARTAVAGNSIVAPGDRVLFNRGDTFAYTAASSLGVMANVLLAAYGTGNRPLVQYAGTGSSEAGAAITTASTASALSYMDIEFNCESTADSSLAYGCNTWMDNILLLRVDLGNTYSNVFYTDGLFVVESAISGSRNMYYNGERLAVLDSDLGPCTETHNIYGSRIERGVISGNSFHNTALVAIRVSAQSATGDTYNVIVSGNDVDSIYTGVLVGSSSGTPVYNLYNVQVERNHISNATEGFKTHKTTPTDVIVRNNIIESTTIPVFVSNYVSPGGGPNEGIKGLRFYNNTIDATVNLPVRIQTNDHVGVEFINNIIRTTSSAAATRWVTVELTAGMGELTFDYNLYHAPNRAGDPDLFDVEGTDYTFTEWQAVIQDVNSPSPADPDFNAGGATGYELEDTSPAIGAGDTLVLVREDYANPTTVAGSVRRPQGVGYDIGAFERTIAASYPAASGYGFSGRSLIIPS